MSTIDEVLKEFPPRTREKVKAVWEALPTPLQSELETILKAVPIQPQLLRRLIDIALHQYKTVSGKKNKIAIIGPANVGKSTLYNNLIRSKTDQAEVGPLPGTTRINQEADAGFFSIVDTPGADAVGEVGEIEKQHALAGARQADFLIVVFDAIQGVKKTEQELFEELAEFDKPFLVVLNKIDLVKRSEERVIAKAASTLNLEPGQIVATNAKGGKNIEQVVMAIAKVDPETIAALSRALPEFRWQLAWSAIVSSASMAGLIGAAPIPFVDFAPLIAVQGAMVLSIARIYQYEITLKRAKELIVTFGLGFLGRALFQELSKLGGLPGYVLAAAIAASTTVVMGYASIVWFQKGEKLTSESLQKMTKDITDILLKSFKNLGKSRPSKTALQQAIQNGLENSPLAGQQPDLDGSPLPNPPPTDPNTKSS
jgi:small GTP-binding protein